MTSVLWLTRPVATFTIADLVATQPGVTFAALLAAAPPYGGDPFPHVVIWGGVRYLEDGHHRVMRALIAGARTIEARWISVEDQPTTKPKG